MIPLDQAAGSRDAGAKAQVLARARAAGLPVPDGIVVTPEEELDPPGIAAALARLAPDGARFAVRSSADVEDRPEASAAGVFDSVVGVRADEVAAAVERVRASGERHAARAYLASRGIARARVAVLIQPLVEASALGVLHTAPLDEMGMAVEERAAGEPEWGEVAPRRVAPDHPLAQGARRLAAIIGGEADVEYALTESGPVFLQARPLSAALPVRDTGGWDPGDDGPWRRDAEHNPEPLSAAQTSLVALVEGLPGAAPQRVIQGFLFRRLEGAAPPSRVIAPADLPRVFAGEVVARAEEELGPLELLERPPIGEALRVFRAVVARHVGEVAPSLARARGHLDQLLRMNLGEPLSVHGALLAGTGESTVARDAALWRIGRADPAERPRLIAEYARRYGAYAPAWDVAVACDDELPTRVMQVAALVGRGPSPEVRHAEAREAAEGAASALLGRLDRMARGAFKHLLPVVRAALAVGEADDELYFRAQRLVRRALLGVGTQLALEGALPDPSLVAELPIDLERPDALVGGAVDVERALAGRAARMARRALSPPSEIRARRPTWRGSSGGGVLRGAGTTGRGWGRAFVLRDPASAPAALPAGAVLVTPAILPSLGYLIPGAAALVTDYGGALSHGATLAREYGVPAVLGTGSATAMLRDGEDLLVDADAARVYRIAP